METPSSARRPRWRSGLRHRTGLALAAGMGGLALTIAGASPSAAADPGDTARVSKLTKQIKALEKEYGGDLAQLRDAQADATDALKKVNSLKSDLTDARNTVAQLAANQYMSNGMDPAVTFLAADDPTTMLGGAALASHLAQNHAAKVQQIQTLVTQQDKARQQAKAKIAKLQTDIKELTRQKARVQALLKKYKPESPLIGNSGLTSRMVKVRTEVDQEFGPFIVIGCLRPGDPQDHGTGRACDFMESSGGRMPTAARQANGDAVSAYVIKNASRLGIKYVIWKQRIYDMRNPGWRAMSDRGGITANHYDHVHISVF